MPLLRPVLRCVIASAALLNVGCYSRLQPRPPVVDDVGQWLRDAPRAPTPAAEARYEGMAPPLLLWAVDFSEEVLVELEGDPTYTMIEVTRAKARDGSVHDFALVSSRDGQQSVAVGNPGSLSLARALPLPAYDGGLRVVDLRANGFVERVSAMDLPDGRRLQMAVQAKATGSPPTPRSGSAMNHSQDRLLAAIDLRAFNWGTPLVSIDGTAAKVRALAPGLPFAWRLEQSAGGARAGVGQWADERGVLRWTEDNGASITLRPTASASTLVLEGEDGLAQWRWACAPQPTGACPWTWAEVRQGATTARWDFSPPLPDLRYPIADEHRSRFVLGLDAQPGLVGGEIAVRHHAGGWTVDVLPEAPFWACERPIRAEILEGGKGLWSYRAEVRPELAAGGEGRDRCFAFAPKILDGG